MCNNCNNLDEEDEDIDIGIILEDLDNLTDVELSNHPKLNYYINTLEDSIPYDSHCQCPHVMPPCYHCENFQRQSYELKRLIKVKKGTSKSVIEQNIKDISLNIF